MWKQRMWLLGMVACLCLSYCDNCGAETWRLKEGQEWEPVAADPQEQYLHAVAEIKELAREGDTKAVKAALKQLKEEFPDRVGPDFELFVLGELQYWRGHYSKALAKFEKVLKDYPAGEHAGAALEREFDMALEYFQGRKKTVLGFIRISGYAEAVEIMERISDRAGLDEPNGIGLRAAIEVAEHFEAQEKYFHAYLKWSEIASYWESGPIGKRALYRMAEDNLAAYDQYRPDERPHYDASKLDTARTYYQKFLALYPEEARQKEVPEKIRQIDEQMAYKQLAIGRYYRRTGERRAANLYFDMIVRNWPQTEAAVLARQALAGEEIRGK